MKTFGRWVPLFVMPFPPSLILSLGSSSNDDGDGNENIKKAIGFGHVHTNSNIPETAYFFYPDSCGWGLKLLWGAVSKRCGFGDRILWFRVDEKPIRVKRMRFHTARLRRENTCNTG